MAVMRKMVRGNAHGCDENSSQRRRLAEAEWLRKGEEKG